MAFRSEALRDRTSSSVMGLFRNLVSSGRSTPSQLDANEVLKCFLSLPSRETTGSSTAKGTASNPDPAREAAMNHVRRMRISAA